MVIKNGKVILFKNNDVIIKKSDIQIEEGKIAKIQEQIEPKKEQ